MKKISLFVFTVLMSVGAFSQEKSEKIKGRPNIPGTFLVEFGFNRTLSEPDGFDIGFWGSRTFNLYYQHEIKIPILKNKFSFLPGIGLGMERFKFKNNKTLGYKNNNPDDSLLMISYTGAKKSQLIANYLDIPIELRFSTNPNDPGRSFKAAIGFRAGIPISTFTKIKYTIDGDTMKQKDKRSWNFNDFRYGVYTRIGAGNFSVFGYYNMSTYFKKDRGVAGKDMMAYTVGISLAGF